MIYAPMNFIVDESAGTAVVDHLRAAGHDVLAVAEAMPQAGDRDILARAKSERRILITNLGWSWFTPSQSHRGSLVPFIFGFCAPAQKPGLTFQEGI